MLDVPLEICYKDRHMTLFYTDPAEYNQDYFEQLDRENEEAQAEVATYEARGEYKLLRKEWKGLHSQFSPADATNESFDTRCKMRLACEGWKLTPANWVKAGQQVVATAQLRVDESWSFVSDMGEET